MDDLNDLGIEIAGGLAEFLCRIEDDGKVVAVAVYVDGVRYVPETPLARAADDLLEALRHVEWGGCIPPDDEITWTLLSCPSCNGIFPDDAKEASDEGYNTSDWAVGHAPDCELAAAIAKAEGQP